MPLLLCAVVFLGIVSVVQAQEPADIPLFLGSGVRVDDHPNDFPEYELYAPETTEVCTPEDMGNSCGRVWWNSRRPVLGTRYVTQVPPMVRLHGPGPDAWWIPFVHCVVEDADRKRRSTSPPGGQCMTVLKRPEEHMEWAIGGIAEGIDPAVPGTYTGMIPLTVTGPGTHWELDIPVSYTVHASSCACTFSTSGPQELDFGTVEIPLPGEEAVVREWPSHQKVEMIATHEGCNRGFSARPDVVVTNFPGPGVSFITDNQGHFTFSKGPNRLLWTMSNIRVMVTSEATPGPQRGEIKIILQCSS